ncbi:unnamed protein product [Clavelina lepadiformis]|uniref:Uncharacterized protein n=1 Tax=Clavelina lepadiformis TaxID=159417 RepID=A0ABP0F1Y2_CLALP
MIENRFNAVHQWMGKEILSRTGAWFLGGISSGTSTVMYGERCQCCPIDGSAERKPLLFGRIVDEDSCGAGGDISIE